MQAHTRDRAGLIRKVREQVELLHLLGGNFDSGQRVMAYPLATVIRVLVHDTSASHALLAQLGELFTMQFLDTSLPMNLSGPIKTNGGLVLLTQTAGGDALWAPLCEAPTPASAAQPGQIAFQPWWENDVLSDSNGTPWSRGRMVLTIANKEGGAHIDPSQPMDVHAIQEQNSMGLSYKDPIAGNRPMSSGPLLPAIRQIAYELEQSITTHLSSELAQP